MTTILAVVAIIALLVGIGLIAADNGYGSIGIILALILGGFSFLSWRDKRREEERLASFRHKPTGTIGPDDKTAA